MAGVPHITVEPDRATLDTELGIRVSGLPPLRPVMVRSAGTDGLGRALAACATFEADADGVVDLGTTAPTSGTYAAADPMGLVWSMSPVPGAPVAAVPGDLLLPSTLTLTAEVGGDAVATACVQRARLPDDVGRSVIRDAGLVGTLFHPIDDGPRPGVILLGGSEGGLHELDAALLANHGFAVLALAYFGAEGLPSHLVEVPLEYFEAAIALLRAHPAVQGGPVGVMGGLRGGEAALLIGATFDGVGAVVSTVGSGVLTQGIGPGPDLVEITGTPVASWTLAGRPLPYLLNRITPELRQQIASRDAVELALAFEPAMADPAEVEACAIRVERIRGAVLLVSAGKDRMWPSGSMSEVAARRLAAAGVRHEHLHFADAGHPIAPPPYGPATELSSPGPGVTFSMGGTPAANAAARAAAWHRSIEFLSEHLGA
jgi:dienelactone hydrolase